MHTTNLPMVTIVAEALLQERLIEELKRAGATGHTLWPVQGEGSRHLRAGNLPGENIRIETIVSPAVADRLLEVMTQNYFPYFALIVYVSEVRVVRGEKYIGAAGHPSPENG